MSWTSITSLNILTCRCDKGHLGTVVNYSQGVFKHSQMQYTMEPKECLICKSQWAHTLDSKRLI
jgi:hypothetical protein